MAANAEKQFAKLQEFIAAEHWQQAVGVCDQSTKTRLQTAKHKPKNDDTCVAWACIAVLKLPGLGNDEDVVKSKVICLIKLDRFADALALCNSDALRFERAYCMYRLQRVRRKRAHEQLRCAVYAYCDTCVCWYCCSWRKRCRSAQRTRHRPLRSTCERSCCIAWVATTSARASTAA